MPEVTRDRTIEEVIEGLFNEVETSFEKGDYGRVEAVKDVMALIVLHNLKENDGGSLVLGLGSERPVGKAVYTEAVEDLQTEIVGKSVRDPRYRDSVRSDGPGLWNLNGKYNMEMVQEQFLGMVHKLHS